MAGHVDSHDLLRQVPAFLQRVAQFETYTDANVRHALEAVGLEPLPGDSDEADDHGSRLAFAYPVGVDQVAYERRLRSAVTRTLGKPTGGDKHWDAGCATATVHCWDRVKVHLRAQYSLTRLRSAAADWLGGTDTYEWLVAWGFADPASAFGDVPSPLSPEVDLARASVHVVDDVEAKIGLYLESGVRPPGVKGSTAEERWDAGLAFLADSLGEPTRTGWWHQESRSFDVAGMRSYALSITFGQAPTGQVHGPQGRLSTIPKTPDPDPAAAADLLVALAGVRGKTWEEAGPELLAAGAITHDLPEHRSTGLTVTSGSGQPLEVGLVDGRVSSATVEATPSTAWDAVLPAFAERFGHTDPQGFDTRWPLGTMIVGRGGTVGDNGFERLRYRVAEDTTQAVKGASAWLLGGEPLGELRAHDAWHARCTGAALSAEVVPAVVAGQPVWRVDDRIAWLHGDRLLGAGLGAWPGWASGMPAGGESRPAPVDQLATFVDTVARWIQPTFDDAVDALVDLGWATTDPDTLRWFGRNYLTINLRRPAGCTFGASVQDGRLQRWTLTVVSRRDPGSFRPVGTTLLELLAPYTGPAAGASAAVGEYAVRVSGGTRLDLIGSRRDFVAP